MKTENNSEYKNTNMDPAQATYTEKPKTLFKTLNRILKYSKKYGIAVIIGLIASIIGTILMLAGPSKLSELTNIIKDGLSTSIDLDKILKIAIILIVFYSLHWIFNSIQGWIMATVTQKISYEMRKDISVKINKVPMSYFSKVPTGDILSRVTNDVDTIGSSLNNSLGTMVSSIVLLLGSLLMMFITNWLLAVTAVLSSLIGFVLMLYIMSKSQKYFGIQQNAIGEINGEVEEAYSGHTVIKAYNDETHVKSVFDKMNKTLENGSFKAQSYSGLMMPIMSFIGNFSYVVICVVGALLAINGKITIGTIVAFTLYVRYFTQPLSQIAQSFQSLQSAAAAGERTFEFIDTEEMADESEKTKTLESVNGNVEFDHVKFSYDDPNNLIIKDFSCKVNPGEKIAIVGPTGAGKTTIVNLLMRFYELNSGNIKIDGVPTTDVKRENIHDEFCMVLQDTWLFEGTVRENLVYSMTNITDDKIKKACDAVGISHFIKTLPKGYDTVLSESSSLSAGQKQQLTIARAMISDRPMLILDEATSSVDTRTEEKIQKAMDVLMEDRTSFVIAHRLSTIRNANLILVLNHGDVIESGTHEELLAKKGFYADLYNSQFVDS